MGDIDPDELGLSRGLAKQLDEWAARYDATLNQEYPRDPDFETPEDRQQFIDDGKTLSERVARELWPSFVVRYFPEPR